MAGIFQRIFKIGEAQAHTVIDKFEDPIKLTEQGIRDLKNDLQSAMTSLAEVKGLAIRLKKDGEDQKKLAADYERKAMLLLQRAKEGAMDMPQAERLATEALTRKEEANQNAVRLLSEYEAQEKLGNQLQVSINQLKSKVSTYENDLITLRARAKTAQSTKKINKQISKVDSSGTVAMLEKMKQKVLDDEAIAEAYGQIAKAETSVDEEINAALKGAEKPQIEDKLTALKKQLGMVE